MSLHLETISTVQHIGVLYSLLTVSEKRIRRAGSLLLALSVDKMLCVGEKTRLSGRAAVSASET